MAYDFKREFRDLYQPKTAPALVDVPAMTFAAVAGAGDPNVEGGAYKRALGLLYAFSYTVKMSKMGDWQPEGYFDYVVPPLEGLWWGGEGALIPSTYFSPIAQKNRRRSRKRTFASFANGLPPLPATPPPSSRAAGPSAGRTCR